MLRNSAPIAAAALSALIIDDEILEREKLRLLLEEETDLALGGEHTSAAGAIEAVAATEPHVVFIDVQMPQLAAEELLERLAARTPPPAVVVMAYEAAALRGLDPSVFAYLLKPIDPDCLHGVLEQLRLALRSGEGPTLAERLQRLARERRQRRRYPEHLTVSYPGRALYLRTADLDWLEAVGETVTLHLGERTVETQAPLDSLEPQLDPARFVALHPGMIVNVAKVSEVRPLRGGEHAVVLRGGKVLVAARGCRDVLFKAIGDAELEG